MSKRLLYIAPIAVVGFMAAGAPTTAAVWSGGMGRNRRYLEEIFGRLRIDPAVPDAMVNLFCESETSGGLLFAVDRERVAAVHEGFAQAGEPIWEIGEVTAEPHLALI